VNKAERTELLSRWIQPSSPTEQDRQDRAERMIRDALGAHKALSGTDYRIYAKGSYANNTNVRIDSDVDIVVECRECFYPEYAQDAIPTADSTTSYKGPWTPARWREEVVAAITAYFGRASVDSTGPIALVISEVVGSRPSADVVPSFHFRKYRSGDRAQYSDGTAVFRTSGERIINWPQQQLENGRRKNEETGRRYKNYVRALKNAENYLAATGVITEKPSYLMECLVWNVPNKTLCHEDLDGGFKNMLVWLWGHLTNEYIHENWFEPNRLKYAFGDGQKWTVNDAKELVQVTCNYFGYGS
jgi:hypothetical protein